MSQKRSVFPLICAALWGAAFTGAPAASAAPRALERFEFTEIQMGAPWKIVLYASSEDVAQRAAKAAFARVAELNHVLSDFDDESELTKLSRSAPSPAAIPLSDDLWNVLQASQALAEKTDGAFDVTVGPMTRLWRRARRNKEMPPAKMLEAAREATDYRALQLDPARRTAKLLKPKMRLDLGGIGMGYAVDEALKVLAEHGISHALIDASGDIGVSNPPLGKKGWRIGIAPLSGNGPPSRYVLLANAALTTSGDAFQAVEIEGNRYSHIVDSRTGLGLTERSAVTVIGPNCTMADSYATAVCVLGAKKGLALIDSTPGAAVLIVRQEGAGDSSDRVETYESRCFAKYVEEAEPQRRGDAEKKAANGRK